MKFIAANKGHFYCPMLTLKSKIQTAALIFSQQNSCIMNVRVLEYQQMLGG
jgi:hypothetical protein